jgi:hypothetical protein
MGILFKNVDDIEVIKSLFPKECNINKADDLDIYGDKSQAGEAYYIDYNFLLIPVNSKEIIQALTGDREIDCITWDVHICWMDGGSYWEPPTSEEKELVLNVSFEDAIKAIHAEMLQNNINNTLEAFYYQSNKVKSNMEN